MKTEINKAIELAAVNYVLKMAIPSLDPENFNNLELALKALCSNRNLDAVMCLDCMTFIDHDTAPAHVCETIPKDK